MSQDQGAKPPIGADMGGAYVPRGEVFSVLSSVLAMADWRIVGHDWGVQQGRFHG